MRILVCGGRDFANPIPYDHSFENKKSMDEYRFVMKELNSLVLPLSKEFTENDNWLPTDITIISGMAKGVDSVAADWAVANYAKLEPYHADWNKYKKAAGPIRNQRMLDEGKPDLVIAFPGGSGTAHMKRIARSAGVKVIEVEYKGE